MKTLLALATITLTACSQTAKEPYPQGFNIGQHMYYWNPKLAHAVWGSNQPPKDPISKAWVVTDEEGGFYMSPELQAKLKN